MRKAISKETRQKVYQKYDGRCAYCGKKLAYKDMQVDHLIPLRPWNEKDNGNNSLENLMPSCRTCNHYKRAHTLETFREYISTIPSKLARDNYIYKVGMAYGFYDDKHKEIKFHFEEVLDMDEKQCCKGCNNFNIYENKCAFDEKPCYKGGRLLREMPCGNYAENGWQITD